MNPLWEIVRRHKAGEPVGVYSVCSAHPTVLEAAMRQAADDGSSVLIEATSNQVDQFGGYTGMRPADFRALVFSIADSCGFPRESIVLGGDHLGPNRWQQEPAETAMAKADDLVAAYVEAGYTKIHIDASMSCAGDPVPAGDELVATRTARLVRVAEKALARAGATHELLYVIGTEVPVPGGAHETLDALVPTSAAAARATLDRHRMAFDDAGVAHVWPRIIALVVQPAVEFDHLRVIDYRREGTRSLRTVLDDEPGLVFEAHSTDYQQTARLRELVEDHWAILKVGPGLTFAMREGLFALEQIERELVPPGERSGLAEVVERQMLARPEHWAGYYGGSQEEQRLARRFSYSDRLRYYWPDPLVVRAEERLYANLSDRDIPLPLISQFLPAQYARVREGRLEAQPRALVLDRVRDALRPYAVACSLAEVSTTDPHHHLKEHHVSGLTASRAEPSGATATAREIDQQPEVWRAVAQIVELRRAELETFLTPLLERRELRIVLTGAGTSAFVGLIAAPALARSLGRRVDAVATTDIVSDPHGSFPEDVPTLLVSFARSGNSPESIAATRVADQVLNEVSHLVLTCDDRGALSMEHAGRANSHVLLMPERSNDEGFAMTSSFTSMLLATLLVFSGPNEHAVSALIAAARHVLESVQGEVESLAERPIDRVVYLGSGPLAGLARESALKLLELTAGRVVGHHDSALGFRHGPKAILNDRTLVVVYVSSDPYTRRYDLDILTELRSGAPSYDVIAISASALGGLEERSWVLPGTEGLPDAFAAIALVVFAQLLALRLSVRLGLIPDNPFPGGDVNRVVRGVRIHDLDDRP